MTLTVWYHFLTLQSPADCEAYLRFHLRDVGEARLTQVCERYMRATEHPACSLSVTDGRVRVDRPLDWTLKISVKRSNRGERASGPGMRVIATPTNP